MVRLDLDRIRQDRDADPVRSFKGGGTETALSSLAEREEAPTAVCASAGNLGQVVAVQPAGAPAMALSWRRGSVLETDAIDTIADGVAGRCPIPEVLDDLLVVVDDVVLVGEESIKAGMRLLYRHAGLVAEPSQHSVSPPSWRTVTASPAGGWPRSSVAATSRLATTNAGC